MYIIDSLKNLVTGLGTAKDKATGNQFVQRTVQINELNAMHRSDWMARKIVDIIPNDMTREWRNWQAKPEQIEKLEEYEGRPQINLQSKFRKAAKLARLHGGSALFLGMSDMMHDQPLDLERVGAEGLQYIHVLRRNELTCGNPIRDVLSPFHGEPEYYEYTRKDGNGAIRIHPSRVRRFLGAEVLDDELWDAQGWGDSVLQICFDAIANAVSTQQHVASLVPELKTDIIHVPGLFNLLKNPVTRAAVYDRFAHANMIRSMFGMVLMDGGKGPDGKDGGEQWEQKQISFNQLPDLIAKYLEIACGAADIPVTRFLGQSPGGLNATGDSDIRNYYDNCAARQKEEFSPALDYIDEVLIRSTLGARDPDIHYTWAPLWGLSEKEKAEIFNTKAQAARTLIGSGGANPQLLPINALSDALVNMLIEDGVLPGLEAAIEEHGRLADQEDDEDDEALEAAALLAAGGEGARLVNPDVEEAEVVDSAIPRTLYVSRQVLNGAAILAWARSQGIPDLVEEAELHVTICYSRAPIDWMSVGESWQADMKVQAGGPRVVEQFGSYVALLFSSSELKWRHSAMIEEGASYDYADYQPHISVAKTEGFDLSNVKPYTGEILLGPEIFEEIKDD